MRRFTPAEITKLKELAAWGHDASSIGRQLGNRTPQSIRVKAVELGIKLRPVSADCRRIKLSAEAWDGLQTEARARGVSSPGRLARQLLEIIVRDRLYAAIIDPPPPPRRMVETLDPKWANALAVTRIFDRR